MPEDDEVPIQKKNLIDKNKRALETLKEIHENIPKKMRNLADYVEVEIAKNIDMCEKNDIVLNNLPDDVFIDQAPSVAIINPETVLSRISIFTNIECNFWNSRK